MALCAVILEPSGGFGFTIIAVAGGLAALVYVVARQMSKGVEAEALAKRAEVEIAARQANQSGFVATTSSSTPHASPRSSAGALWFIGCVLAVQLLRRR